MAAARERRMALSFMVKVDVEYLIRDMRVKEESWKMV